MFKGLRKFDPIVHLVLLISIIALFSIVFFMLRRVGKLNLLLTKGEARPVASLENDELEKTSEEILTEVNIDELRAIVSDIIATISANPQTIIKREVTTAGGKTSYISLGTSATTTSTDWKDVKDAQVSINLEKDFGKNAKVSWEASLKVAHGNGQAHARLYDDTNKIVVLGSEISTANNSEFEQVASGDLNLWSGNNLYKVQIKSLNSFEITYSGGRIKVSY